MAEGFGVANNDGGDEFDYEDMMAGEVVEKLEEVGVVDNYSISVCVCVCVQSDIADPFIRDPSSHSKGSPIPD